MTGPSGSPLSTDGSPVASSGADGLVARQVAKSYGRSRVLADVDLTIPGGTLAAVVGANGAGKSTLLACLAGVVAHEGTVSLDGQIPPPPGSITYLPQRARLPGTATVDETLALFRAFAEPRQDRVELPAGFVPEGHRRIGELSGGQAQRVALAAVLLGTPGLVLLDEPFANLDDAARDTVHAILDVHRRAGAIVLVASPITAFDVLGAADLVVRVEAGKIVYRGSSDGFMETLPTTIWVAVPDRTEALGLMQMSLVVGARHAGPWVGLRCRERDAPAVVAALRERGITDDRIRIAGPDDTVGAGAPLDRQDGAA